MSSPIRMDTPSTTNHGQTRPGGSTSTTIAVTTNPSTAPATSSTTSPTQQSQQPQQQQSFMSDRPRPSTFAWSDPPDLFRSLQKDEYQLSHWRNEVSELTSNLLGSHATNYEPEIDLITRGTYYGCTSLLGRQTLGEEYCDLMPATTRPLQPRSRTSPSASSSLAASSSASVSISAGSPATVASSTLTTPSSTSSVASPLYSWAVYPSFSLLSTPRRVALFTCQVILPYMYDKAQQHSRQLLFHDLPVEFSPHGYQLVHESNPWLQFQIKLKRIWNRMMSFLLRTDYTLMNQLARGHLALFYLYGRYLEFSKRFLGVRYIQLRQSGVDRPGYELFGILLMIQVCVGLAQLLKQYIILLHDTARANAASIEQLHPLPGLHAPSIPPDAESASGFYSLNAHEVDDDEEDAEGRMRLLPPAPTAASIHHQPQSRPRNVQESKEADTDDEEEDEEEEEETANCTLCLCPRVDTTATECGHLYCWSCISECCTNKPECPMCRQPCALNTLLLLAHYK